MEYKDNVIGLQHIGIPTRQINTSIKFYESIGFIKKGEYNNNKVCFMELKNIIIEIYEECTVNYTDGAINHFAINVKNINEVFEMMQEKKVKIIEGITELPFWDRGIQFFVIEGINRERIEFSQYL